MKIQTFLVMAATVALLSCGRGTGTSAGVDASSSYLFNYATSFQPSFVGTFGTATDLVIGNISNDSYPDILVLGGSSGVVAFINTDGTQFNPGTRLSTTPNDFQVAALSGSNVAAARASSGSLHLIQDGGAGVLRLSETFLLAGSAPVTSMAVADSYLFVLTGTAQSFITKFGTTNYEGQTTVADFNSIEGKVMAADLNVDSGGQLKDFVAIPTNGASFVKFYSGNAPLAGNIAVPPSLVSGTPLTRSSSNRVTDFQIGNLAGSTLADIMIATTAGFEAYTNTATSTAMGFAAASSLVLNATATSFALGDFVNQDGKLDVYAVASGSSAKLFHQSATNSLEFADVTTSGLNTSSQLSSPIKVYSADFNADGYADLVELDASGTVRVFINNRKTL